MSYEIVPPGLREFTVPVRVLDDTWELLRESGREGLEAMVLWLGVVLDEHRAEIVAAFRPRQTAYRSTLGLAVEIPQEELTRIIAALPAGVHLLARVHTHPTGAYHSQTDDLNMVIGHVGAISIVVPEFAAGSPSLRGCSVNRLRGDGTWAELSEDDVAECLRVVP